MSDISFVFRTSPHAVASGREGIDALLATSALTESLSVIFMGDGVFQLLANQSPEHILSKHYAPMLKLFELYDIHHVVACRESLRQRGLKTDMLAIDVTVMSSTEISDIIHHSHKVLSF